MGIVDTTWLTTRHVPPHFDSMVSEGNQGAMRTKQEDTERCQITTDPQNQQWREIWGVDSPNPKEFVLVSFSRGRIPTPREDKVAHQAHREASRWKEKFQRDLITTQA